MPSHSFDTVTVDQAPVTRDQRSDLRMFTSGDAETDRIHDRGSDLLHLEEIEEIFDRGRLFQCTSSTHYEIFMHFWFSFEKQASAFPLLENLPGMSAYIPRS